jgi:hypothetical protein
MVQQTAARAEHPPEPAEVGPELRQLHVLEHPDRADRVERPVGLVAVVLVPDLDALPRPPSATAFSAHSAWRRESVTPETIDLTSTTVEVVSERRG